MATIPLSRGAQALVDDDEFEAIANFASWTAKPIGRRIGGFYAYCTRNGTTLYMHRLILGARPGEQVDHINGDGLDNRRSNLRIATYSQNGSNRPYELGRSGYRGVHVERGKYRARIRVETRNYSLGMFDTAEEAAAAYDAAAIEAFGPFARLNSAKVGAP